jgi:hypothetical protein
VDERMLEWFEVLARVLMWGAVLAVALGIVLAIAIATSDTTVLGFEDIQREGRGIASVAALGFGIGGAGILAGLGGILRLLVEAERRDRNRR